MASLALLAAQGGLTDPNLGLTIWTLVLFILFFAILTKFGWKPILQLIDEREKSVREAVLGAEKARNEAQALVAQQQEMIRESGRQREEAIKRALADAEQVKNDVVGQARAEAERLVQNAKQQIEREKRLAIQELREQVADLAVEAASRIVKSSMTPDAQKQLVREFVDKLPSARS
jgi:F-type H+-transporting ATPase subunit b